MQIVSWNVNGLRAAVSKGFLSWLDEASPDICCLQEIKASHDKIPAEVRELLGYHTTFVPAARPGYSGVALLSRRQPLQVREGMGQPEFDQEGRVVAAEYPDFVLVNTYFPNGKASSERLRYKMAFYEAYLGFLRALGPKPVVICGDVNTAHQPIDLARPKENERVSGFLPEERAWIDRLLAQGYLDAFRLFCAEPGQYTWWDQKSRARDRNVGWRIDYFLVAAALQSRVRTAEILSSVMGSDHCPITLQLAV